MSVILEVNKQKLSMEVDTGAAISVISEAKLFPGVSLSDTPVILTTYTGEKMAVIGEISVITVRYQQKNHCLTLHALKGKSPSLLGKDWLYQLRLYIQGLWKTTVNYPQPIQ